MLLLRLSKFQYSPVPRHRPAPRRWAGTPRGPAAGAAPPPPPPCSCSSPSSCSWPPCFSSSWTGAGKAGAGKAAAAAGAADAAEALLPLLQGSSPPTSLCSSLAACRGLFVWGAAPAALPFLLMPGSRPPSRPFFLAAGGVSSSCSSAPARMSSPRGASSPPLCSSLNLPDDPNLSLRKLLPAHSFAATTFSLVSGCITCSALTMATMVRPRTVETIPPSSPNKSSQPKSGDN
mmetsp:Transcript_44596/g.74073  ORF Transcript_44596/g.74073 Transcript_44596/m.74073 type:complete len:233 (-) Transcript_44596:4277-4975(-)